MKNKARFAVFTLIFCGASGATGTLRAEEACVSASQIAEMAQPLQCKSLSTIEADESMLPFNCHTQGIAWHAPARQFVITCMDRGGQFGRIVSFPFEANNNGRWRGVSASAFRSENGGKHPSATQFNGDLFPVAFAPNVNKGPSVIKFYSMQSGGLISDSITSLLWYPGHIGGLAFANFAGDSWLMGCGWDCSSLVFWRASGEYRSSDYSLFKVARTKDLVEPGIDENVGSYQSIQLASRCEDKMPLLFASQGSSLDVWEIHNLGKIDVSLQKIVKSRVGRGVVNQGGSSLFYEGMTLITGMDRLQILAAPDDFNASDCNKGSRCSPQVYLCGFGK